MTKQSVEGLRVAQYAGQYWVDHAELGSVSSHTEDMIKRVFDPEYHHFANWVWIYDTILNRPGTSEVPTRPDRAPIHYAARHGFHQVAEWLSAYHHMLPVSNPVQSRLFDPVAYCVQTRAVYGGAGFAPASRTYQRS